MITWIASIILVVGALALTIYELLIRYIKDREYKIQLTESKKAEIEKVIRDHPYVVWKMIDSVAYTCTKREGRRVERWYWVGFCIGFIPCFLDVFSR
jgi:hypothetical protein